MRLRFYKDLNIDIERLLFISPEAIIDINNNVDTINYLI